MPSPLKTLGLREEENHIYINESLTERNKELFNAAFKVRSPSGAYNSTVFVQRRFHK